LEEAAGKGVQKGAEGAGLNDGSGEAFAERLAEVVYGGQVVLSETSWSAIQDQLPGQSQVCCLDTGIILCCLILWPPYQKEFAWRTT
jgi:hypothetical protein